MRYDHSITAPMALARRGFSATSAMPRGRYALPDAPPKPVEALVLIAPETVLAGRFVRLMSVVEAVSGVCPRPRFRGSVPVLPSFIVAAFLASGHRAGRAGRGGACSGPPGRVAGALPPALPPRREARTARRTRRPA